MERDRSHPQITVRFEDLDALEREIESNLGAGRAFVSGTADVTDRQRCVLVLIHPHSQAALELEAEVVYVRAEEPGAGIGLELTGFDDAAAERLRSFALASKPKQGGAPGDLMSRVRSFTVAEQMRSAREGDYPERVALERVYGKAVWDVLLHNRKITAPEVLRIARTPKLPKHLVETITGNASWLAVSSLRRALLLNPQVTGASLAKVLRATPRPELALMAKQTNYPIAVRQAIKKLLGR